MIAAETLEEMAAAARDTGDVAPLLERIRLAEDVMDAANGPDSMERLVAAMDVYQGRFGKVPATYRPDY